MLETTRNRGIVGVALFVAGAAMLGTGCQTNAQTGALIGAGIGAAVGQWIGDDTEATLIGAGVGSAAGYMLGNEEDKAETRERATEPTDEEDR